MSFEHVTVLKEEAASLLATAPGRRIVDGTLGGGGHAELMLERGARVIGIDRDERALSAAKERLARFGDRFTPVHARFDEIRSVLDTLEIDLVDGALVDLGVSSPQLDVADRGFSFMREGPLDMRMDASRGATLAEKLATTDERELTTVLRTFGEEQAARKIAHAIVEAVAEGRVRTTTELAAVIAKVAPGARARGIHPATRSFQGLRIWVNDELGALSTWLDTLPSIIAPGGRAAAISFHSLEDRPVKQRFSELSTGCICPPDLPICGCGRTAGWKLVMRKGVQASDAEVAANPRSRSARLRCVERNAA